MRITETKQLNLLLQQTLEKYKKLTSREHLIISCAIVTLILMATYKIYEPIQAAFTNQNTQLAQVESQAKTVGPMLERYAKLKSRRDAIEREYKEVEFKEGELAHLEILVKNKAGVSSGFTIKDNPAKEFGGNYEQTPFSVKFNTSDLPSLIDFLKEVTQGARPMILSKLDIQRSRFADRLEIEADISSIKRVNKSDAK